MAASSTAAKLLKPAAKVTALAASISCYVAYRNHDRRVLSGEEVTRARRALSKLTPSASASPSYASSSSASITSASPTSLNPLPLSSPATSSTAKSAHHSSNSNFTTQHLQNLTTYGATIVEDTLSPSQLVEWNARTSEAFNDSKNNVVWNAGRAHCSVPRGSKHYEDMRRIGGCRSSSLSRLGSCEIETRNDESSWLGGFAFWKGKRRKSNDDDQSSNSDSNPALETSTLSSSSSNTESSSSSSSASLQTIVKSYFAHHNIKRYELTDLQFLNAASSSSSQKMVSENQIWHRDNKFRGLTAIVALEDVRGNGPTELILGSHCDDYSLWSTGSRFQGKGGGDVAVDGIVEEDDNDSEKLFGSPLLGCIDAGDAILYDARIFHRGRANNNNNNNAAAIAIIDDNANKNKSNIDSSTNDRPVLVLRWDASRTPPPGAGLIVTTANTYVGRVIYAGLFVLRGIFK